MGRGAATMYAGSLADADCIVVQGSNMAECHPVAYRWVMQAKEKGATIVHVVDGKIVNIEGNPDSPINQGNLCPKGAATFQLHVNPNRLTKVLHRAPGAREWEVWDLERAMDRVAELTKKTRDETFVERLPNGKVVNHTLGIFSLGGATMDNEWNHLQQKLLRGLGVVSIENQARI